MTTLFRWLATLPMMKALTLLLALSSLAPLANAAEPPSPKALLQEALFAEEAERDLEKAGAGYAELLTQYEGQRALAATALFRLAEVRARQGKTPEAIALHQRLVTEFAKEEALVKLSRERLVALGAPVPTAAGPSAISAKEAEELARVREMVKNSPDLLDAPNNDGEAPLVKAALSGWIEVATVLLDHGALVNGKPGTWVPLHWAAKAGRKAMVELLLARGADVNAKSPEGWTALHAAAAHDRVELARVLLEHGAKPEIPLAQHAWPYFEVPGATPLITAIAKKETAMVKLLLEKGADPNFADPESKSTPLTGAAGLDTEEMVTILLQAKARVDQPTGRGMAPLAAAAEGNRLGNAKLLLAHAAPVDAADDWGYTALHYATVRSAALVDLLLAAGASAKAVSKNGWTPLHTSIAGRGFALYSGEGFIQSRTPRAELPKIWSSLLAKGADLNARDNQGRTLLFLALSRSDAGDDYPALGYFAYLISKGARTDIKDGNGKTVFQVAQESQLREPLEPALRYAALTGGPAVTVFRSIAEGTSPQKLEVKAGQPLPTIGEAFSRSFPTPELRNEVQGARLFRVGEEGFVSLKLISSPSEIESSKERLRAGDVLVFQERPSATGQGPRRVRSINNN